MGYDYNMMKRDAEYLAQNFPEASLYSIGESVMEHKIYCIEAGTGSKKLFVNGAHHGLEYLTSAFLMRFLREYLSAVKNHEEMFGYDPSALFRRTTLYTVPMVNPDGVDIAIHGIDITNPYHRHLISMVGIHSFHRVWQANANGVDINHNYDAGWRVVREKPSPSQYSGPYSESEPETQAVVQFVREQKFDMLLAFHSQGGEIYYDYDGKMSEKAEELASRFSQVSGYRPAKPEGDAAFGGCKDWFIQEFGKSGFTIEVGHGQNPLPMELLDQIYQENAPILLCALENA